jgi:hypothetical protein
MTKTAKHYQQKRFTACEREPWTVTHHAGWQMPQRHRGRNFVHILAPGHARPRKAFLQIGLANLKLSQSIT